jgi:hypothetical protein
LIKLLTTQPKLVDAGVRASKKPKKADILSTLSSNMPSILPLAENEPRLDEIIVA